MIAEANAIVQKAIDEAIRHKGEVGLQVCAYLDGKKVIDCWGGVAEQGTDRAVDGETLFPVFSVSKGITNLALHIQADRGLIDYPMPIAEYWPEFGRNGKSKGTVYDALVHRLGIPIAPVTITPERMCDWDWMCAQLADMYPIHEPGTKAAYHGLTHGWIIGELVRRTDPKKRPFGQFVKEELCDPLGIDDLFMGIPDEVEPRIATLVDRGPRSPNAPPLSPQILIAIPPVVGTKEAVFGRPDVRRACIPAANGIMTARAIARVYAMLAGEGELDGVRLLSKERTRLFYAPSPPADYDLVKGTVPHNLSVGGFHLTAPLGRLGRTVAMLPAGKNPWAYGFPGAGGSIGFTDPSTGLAVGITHNRMLDLLVHDENTLFPIGEAIREALGVSG